MKNILKKISTLVILAFLSFQAFGIIVPLEIHASPLSIVAEENGNLNCGNDANKNACKIVDLINSAINVLSGLAGIAISGAIIIAGIQYSTAGANPQAVSEARKRINQALIALIVLLLLYPFLQWVVPGGIF